MIIIWVGFLSVDPIIQAPGNSQSLNPYSYIMNNPLAGTDPSGYASTANEKIETKTRTKRIPPPTGSRLGGGKVTTTVTTNGSGVDASVTVDGKTIAVVSGVIGSDGNVSYSGVGNHNGLDSRSNVGGFECWGE